MVSLKELLDTMQPMPVMHIQAEFITQKAADLANWLKTVPCRFPVDTDATLAYEIGLDESNLPDFSLHVFTYVTRNGKVHQTTIEL